MSSPITWVLETDVFSSGHEAMESAAKAAGHAVDYWDDDWWRTGNWPDLGDTPVVFHGSLGNAARVRSELPWRPGAFCDTAAFHCSAWYDRAAEWLLHERWVFSTVEELTSNPTEVLAELGQAAHVFVRPDSPLKPFSGADLYACDRGAVVPRASDAATTSWSLGA